MQICSVKRFARVNFIFIVITINKNNNPRLDEKTKFSINKDQKDLMSMTIITQTCDQNRRSNTKKTGFKKDH